MILNLKTTSKRTEEGGGGRQQYIKTFLGQGGESHKPDETTNAILKIKAEHCSTKNHTIKPITVQD